MATLTLKKLTSWSFSRYTDYTTCPARAKYKHIDKLKEPPSPAVERGRRIHTLCEQYVKGELDKLPPELQLFKEEFAKLRKLYKNKKLPMEVEENWAFTATWGPSQWDDWNGCWVRIKLDCAHCETPGVVVITDYKTGKMNDYNTSAYAEQLELYALAALLRSTWEEVTVLPRLMYLDHGVVYPPANQQITYTKADLPRLLATWNQRVKPMLADTRFAPKPSANACRWCAFSASKGGPCKY